MYNIIRQFKSHNHKMMRRKKIIIGFYLKKFIEVEGGGTDTLAHCHLMIIDS